MDEREFSETIDTAQNSTISDKDLMQNVNAVFEEMRKDVRKMIEDNNEAAKRE